MLKRIFILSVIGVSIGFLACTSKEIKAEREPAGISATPSNRVGKYADPKTIQDEKWLGMLPDSDITPGAIDPCIHPKEICTTTTEGRRSTTGREKREARQRYLDKYATYRKILDEDVENSQDGEGKDEIDHLISVNIGGADVPENLWAEPFQHKIAGAADKDQVEHHAKPEMCRILNDKENGGAKAADEYLALIQRAMAGGFVNKSGSLKVPKGVVTWYDVYYSTILPYTDQKGKVTDGKKILFADFLQALKPVLKQVKLAEFPSKKGCIAPQIN